MMTPPAVTEPLIFMVVVSLIAATQPRGASPSRRTTGD